MPQNIHINQDDLGNKGGIVIADNDVHSGDWFKITSLSDSTTFATLTSGNITGTPSVLPKGVSLYGQFTAIDLSAGEVVAYNR
jgi:hypothetical protein